MTGGRDMAVLPDSSTAKCAEVLVLPQLTMSRPSLHHDLDDLEDGEIETMEPKHRGHTKNDEKDMNRMGKRQQFIVSLPAPTSPRSPTRPPPAQTYGTAHRKGRFVQ